MTPEEFFRQRIDELADQLIKLAHELAATTKGLTEWGRLEDIKRKPMNLDKERSVLPEGVSSLLPPNR